MRVVIFNDSQSICCEIGGTCPGARFQSLQSRAPARCAHCSFDKSYTYRKCVSKLLVFVQKLIRNSYESHYETRARPVRTLLLRQVVHLPKIQSYYRKSKFLSKLYQSFYQSYWLRARPMRTLLLRQVVHLEIRMKVTKEIRVKVTSQTGSY
jgi:hypothetical protein